MTVNSINKISVNDIRNILLSNGIGFQYYGNENLLIQKPVSIESLNDGCIAFLRKGSIEKYQKLLTSQNLVVIGSDNPQNSDKNINLLHVPDPEIAFYMIVGLFKSQEKMDIHTMTFISPNAVISTP